MEKEEGRSIREWNINCVSFFNNKEVLSKNNKALERFIEKLGEGMTEYRMKINIMEINVTRINSTQNMSIVTSQSSWKVKIFEIYTNKGVEVYNENQSKSYHGQRSSSIIRRNYFIAVWTLKWERDSQVLHVNYAFIQIQNMDYAKEI